MQISLRTTGTRLNAKRPVSVADRGGRSSGNDRLLNISQALSVKPAQNREIRRMHDSGDYNISGIAALFNGSRPTVYRSLERTATLPPRPADTRPVPDIAKYDQLLTPRGERHAPAILLASSP